MDILLNTVLDIVRRSGDIIREHWSRPRHVRHKGSIDLVTETDVAVESFLKDALRDVVPGATFMAEESAATCAEPDGDCWIIDPVDGTTNFVHGIPQVGTSVALWRDGRVELGVVNMPILDECFHARRGQGAWSGDRRLRISEAAALRDAVVGTGFPYDVPVWLPTIQGWLGAVLPQVQGVRRLGAAAVDLAYVACGRLDGFYELGLKPWDLAAGWLLVEEAGGSVSSLSGGPLRFGDVLVASNGRLHQPLLETLAAGKI